MKPKRILLNLAALLVCLSGCGKKQSVAAPETAPAAEPRDKISAATAEAKQTFQAAAAGVETTAAKVVTEAKETAHTVSATASSKLEIVKAEASTLIDKTKALINDQKYQDALNSLKQLSSLTLSPEQQKTVDGFKAQLQKLMSSQVATNAASALGNLLRK